MIQGELQGKGVGRDATDGGVRAELVVFDAPVIDEEASFGEGAEPVLVGAVVAEGAVEAFDEGVLHGFAWLDVVDGDAGGLNPGVNGFAGELRAVVGGDDGRQAVGGGELTRIFHRFGKELAKSPG